MSDFRERLASKMGAPSEGGCMPWLGALGKKGYGRFSVGRRDYIAHRFVYEVARGPIPAGLVIDHLCRNRWCCNPEHLEAVSNQENVLRGVGSTAVNARKTHCLKGHEFTEENTYISPVGSRVCRVCSRDNSRRQNARRARTHERDAPKNRAAEGAHVQ